MFYFKFSKINLNTFSKTIIIIIFSYILIEPIYNIFVNTVTVCYLKVYTIAKKDF